MGREYDDNQSLQQKIINGANKLADNVASTLGPRGRNVLLQEVGAAPFITKDGVTVAHFVSLDDPFENASTVLARAILRESQRFIASGVSPIELQRGIDLTVREIVKNLKEMASPVTSIEDIEHIATISANNDPAIGKLICMAYDRVGQDGSITIEESRSIETSLDVTEGFSFSSGYCAGAFVTDERRSIMHHEEPLILVTDYRISSVDQILPVLEMCAREGRPLVIVADDIEGQALAALIMNAMRGTLKVAAIKAPYYGEERRNTLHDLAISVGATFVSRESGLKLPEIKMVDFGTSKFVESTKGNTIFVGGNADIEAIDTKISSLKADIEDTESLEMCDSIQQRIVRLADQINGAMVVKEACYEPIRQMALNAGHSPDLITKNVLDANSGFGWDFRNNLLTNLLNTGIIDPVKVTRSALQNAASCAGTLITTNYGIIQTESS